VDERYMMRRRATLVEVWWSTRSRCIAGVDGDARRE